MLSSLNHAKYLASAIDSVLEQTHDDFELFIVDDASEDNSWEIIQSYDDPRIIAMRNLTRMRGVYAFNEIIRHRAQGEYIAIHHSDDIWLPEKLERQVAFLDANLDVGAVFTPVDLIDEAGEPFVDTDHFYYSTFRQSNRNRFEWLRHFFHVGNCLCHPSVLIRRNCYEVAGLYDRRLGQLGDFDMWVRLCLHYEIHILDEALTRFRIRSREANQSGNRSETNVRIRNEWFLTLERFLLIRDEAEFFAVFPEMLSLSRPERNCIPFLLAIRATETESDITMTFGLRLLYTLMSDELTAAELQNKYDFSYKSLIALSARIDPFQGAEFFRMARDMKVLQSEAARIKSTFSWKITRPLRLIANLPRLVRKALSRS
jgi:glycosyltransferase involved in cell wall biosynthesis